MKKVKIEIRETTYQNLLISIQDTDVTISEFIDILLDDYHNKK